MKIERQDRADWFSKFTDSLPREHLLDLEAILLKAHFVNEETILWKLINRDLFMMQWDRA